MRAIWIALVVVLFAGCGKSPLEVELNHPIPRAPVYVDLSLDHEGIGLREQLSYHLLLEPRYAYEYVGHQGLVVVHGSALGSYYAYDLLCPHEWPVEVRIELKGNALLPASCPVCGTVYELALGVGNPISGISKYPLRQYKVTRVGTILQVRQ